MVTGRFESYHSVRSSLLNNKLKGCCAPTSHRQRCTLVWTEYNRVVKEYNLELRRVSGKAINPLTGKEFKPRVYFKAESGAKNAPDVNFE